MSTAWRAVSNGGRVKACATPVARLIVRQYGASRAALVSAERSPSWVQMRSKPAASARFTKLMSSSAWPSTYRLSENFNRRRRRTGLRLRGLELRAGRGVLASQPGSRQQHRLDDVLIPGAAAQVAGQPIFDVVDSGVGIALQQLVGAHEKAGGAEPALQAVLVAVGLLDRMQLAVRAGQPFDRHQVGALSLDGEHDARAHGLAVHQDGAGAAYAVLASDVGAGQIALVAQEIHQRLADLDGALVLDAVDAQADGSAGRHLLRLLPVEAERLHHRRVAEAEQQSRPVAGVDVLVEGPRGDGEDVLVLPVQPAVAGDGVAAALDDVVVGTAHVAVGAGALPGLEHLDEAGDGGHDRPSERV